MIFLGIKLTHDGGLALIDDGKLIFSYEMEKINNNFRIQEFNLSIDQIKTILKEYGYSFSQIDKIAIDGWTNSISAWEKPENNYAVLKNFSLNNSEINIELAAYGHLVSENEDILDRKEHTISDLNFPYESYKHIAGHVFGGYCTSSFAKEKKDSYILIWDGGMPPQLFYFKYKTKEVINLGCLFHFFGSIYAGFPHEFEPFNKEVKYDYSVPGKLMAYIALGKENNSIVDRLMEIYKEVVEEYSQSEMHAGIFAGITQKFSEYSKNCAFLKNFDSKDILSSFHKFLEILLIKSLKEKVEQNPHFDKNICFAGGNALNIKWNHEIKASNIFESIWIPPFPNDSGSAIGVACCSMVYNTKEVVLNWGVYKGPSIINDVAKIEFSLFNDLKNKLIDSSSFWKYAFQYSYHSREFDIKDLARLLHEKKEPILFLNGRAELGPRSLGNRSILSPANSKEMKSILNKLKIREAYRPVAPICMEEESSEVFEPGGSDPYMLFEHQVREEWKEKIPAVVHLDGSARLQTINIEQNKEVYELLKHYKELSGIPLLCNTSANLKGRGFFPNLKSAINWGKVNYIWSEGVLYSKYK